MRSKLSEVIEIISGGTPKTSVKEYWKDGDIYWLSVNDFNNDSHYVYKSEKKITQKGVDESNTKFLQKDDVIISARGTVGALAQIYSPMCFNQSCFGLRGKEGILDSTYLYYYLKNYVSHIRKRTHGSVFETINIKSFDLIDIDYPEKILEQKSIIDILRLIDDKIELNNRINAELESMVKTIYEYWFVQFDFPDENGKPYKSSGGKMIWSKELNKEIPSGWEVKRMCKVLQKNTKKFDLNNSKHNIDTLDLSVMPSSTMCLTFKNTSDEFNTNLFKMMKFDILFGGIRPYLFKAGFAPFDGLVTGTVHSFRTLKGDDYNFALLTMVHPSMFQYAISNSKGTKMPVIGADDLLQYKVSYNENVAKVFNETFSFKEMISKNIQENHKLAELRDWLLPMLMNGQVKVEG